MKKVAILKKIIIYYFLGLLIFSLGTAKAATIFKSSEVRYNSSSSVHDQLKYLYQIYDNPFGFVNSCYWTEEDWDEGDEEDGFDYSVCISDYDSDGYRKGACFHEEDSQYADCFYEQNYLMEIKKESKYFDEEECDWNEDYDIYTCENEYKVLEIYKSGEVYLTNLETEESCSVKNGYGYCSTEDE